MGLMDDLRRELERAAAEAQRQAAAGRRQQNAPTGSGGPALDLGLNDTSATPTGTLPLPPAKRLAVVTCMDTRVLVEKALNLRAGDAHILRNAGGLVTDDVLRSLAVSHHALGVQGIIVMGHTDCGMMTFRDDDLRARIRQKMGPAAHLPGTFGAFTSVEASVQAQLRRVRASGLFPPSVSLRGCVYDLKTGRLSEVTPTVAASAAPGRAPQTPALPAATARVGGRLQRQGLQKAALASPALPVGPTTDDFRRKVETMQRDEAAPLNVLGPSVPMPAFDLDIPPDPATAPPSGRTTFALSARDLLRALVLGSVVAAPRAKRPSRTPEPRR